MFRFKIYVSVVRTLLFKLTRLGWLYFSKERSEDWSAFFIVLIWLDYNLLDWHDCCWRVTNCGLSNVEISRHQGRFSDWLQPMTKLKFIWQVTGSRIGDWPTLCVLPHLVRFRAISCQRWQVVINQTRRWISNRMGQRIGESAFCFSFLSFM